MIVNDKLGGRTVQLFIPFEYNGQRIEAITFAPLRFGHVLRWNVGDWPTMLAFMVELAGVEESVIRDLRYPDADRVIEAFLAYVTPEIRTDINNGTIPLKPEQPQQATPAEPKTNGGTEPPIIGAPLPPEPEEGFDLSDEP